MSRRSYFLSRSCEPVLRYRPYTPPLPGTEIDADTMATQTISYMNAFAEHATAIRNCPLSEGAYQRVIDQGRVLPPGTKWPTLDRQGQDDLRHRMEAIIHRSGSASTVEDHLEICSAANTLLLLQHNILNCLPYPESRRIEKRINELRAARRQQLVQQQGRTRSHLPVPPFPPLKRSEPPATCFSLMPDELASLLALPSLPPIIDRKFHFVEPSLNKDIFYQVRRVEMASDGYRIGVQCEKSRDTITFSLDEFKNLLECSVIVGRV